MELSKFIINNSFNDVENYYEPKINEMKSYILLDLMLSSKNMDERKKNVEKYLPENKDSFIYLLELLDKNKTP